MDIEEALNYLAVQPGSLDGAQEELGSVGTWTSIGHGEDTGASVLELEVLVLELVAVDGLATGAVVVSEVTSLKKFLCTASLPIDAKRRIFHVRAKNAHPRGMCSDKICLPGT